MARGKGGRGDSDGRVGKRKGSGSMAWHVVSCVHRRRHRVIPIHVVAVESARGREGGKRGAVTDMSARWRDVLCMRHHHCYVIAIERAEGRREEGTVMDGSARSWHDRLCVRHCRRAVVSCIIAMLLPSRGQEGRREEGTMMGGSARSWCDMLCMRHCHQAVKWRVVTVPLPSRGQEGRREKETVMDGSARSRHDVTCTRHCCRAVKSCVVTMPLPPGGQEGRREEGGSDRCIGTIVWRVVHVSSPLSCRCRQTIVSCVITVPLLSRRQEG